MGCKIAWPPVGSTSSTGADGAGVEPTATAPAVGESDPDAGAAARRGWTIATGHEVRVVVVIARGLRLTSMRTSFASETCSDSWFVARRRRSNDVNLTLRVPPAKRVSRYRNAIDRDLRRDRRSAYEELTRSLNVRRALPPRRDWHRWRGGDGDCRGCLRSTLHVRSRQERDGQHDGYPAGGHRRDRRAKHHRPPRAGGSARCRRRGRGHPHPRCARLHARLGGRRGHRDGRHGRRRDVGRRLGRVRVRNRYLVHDPGGALGRDTRPAEDGRHRRGPLGRVARAGRRKRKKRHRELRRGLESHLAVSLETPRDRGRKRFGDLGARLA